MRKRSLISDRLFLGDGNTIENGRLIIDESNEILEVGKQSDQPDPADEYFPGALCPGFINTHCHLELSHLKNKVEEASGLHAFIPALQAQRKIDPDSIYRSLKAWDQQMRDSGIKAVADISNSTDSLEVKQQSPIYYHSFIELFGLRTEKVDEILQRGLAIKEEFQQHKLAASIVPHAPYSLSDKLIDQIKRVELEGPLSIHNQESEAENQLFEKNEGKIKEMLENFGNDPEQVKRSVDSSLKFTLSHLDPKLKLLLVHNTFSSRADIEYAESVHSKLYWCFCPQANWYIERKLPQLELFAKMGVKCTLGTDSLASNHQLSILEEIKMIRKHFPEIKSESLIQWGSMNGAEFLGLDELGTLEVGKRPGINWIKEIDSEGEIGENSAISAIV